MRRVLLTLAVGALFGISLAGGHPPDTPESTTRDPLPDPVTGGPAKAELPESPPLQSPVLELESSSVDLGIVAEGSEAVGTFTLKNTGAADLKILKVKPG